MSVQPTLILLRGVSGSGKSTFANFLVENFEGPIYEVSADEFMVSYGEYHFDHTRLEYCHRKCLEYTIRMLEKGHSVVVHNVFARESDVAPYVEIAKNFGVKFFSLIVENRHGNSSVHGVPEETIAKQARRMSIQLAPKEKS